MFKRITVGVILLALMMFSLCRCGKRQEEVNTFAARYKAVQDAYNERLNRVKAAGEEAGLLKSKKKDLEELLGKYEGISHSDAAELLKARLLVEISRFREAGQKVDALIEGKSPLIVEAKMVKVHILVHSGDRNKALALFKEIEPHLTDVNDRLTGWLYISLYSHDVKEMEAYSRKFLAAENLPTGLSVYRADIYRNLAALARERRDFTGAKEMLENALTATREEKMKTALESGLKQLDFIGRPAREISVDTWLNSPPLSWDSLRGKVVAIVFWAPWSSACRDLLPVLVEEYDKYKDKGLVVIGYTKLYGAYRDELEQKEFLKEEEELDLLRQYIEKNRLAFPIAVSYEGYSFEDYHVSGIPTLVFIDKLGDIDDITVGAGQPRAIGNKILKLLEETNGKN